MRIIQLLESLVRWLEKNDWLEVRCTVCGSPVAYDNYERHHSHFHASLAQPPR